MSTIITECPSIPISFDPLLLSKQYPKFNAQNLLIIAEWIKKRLDRDEFKMFFNTKEKLITKYLQFMELHEQIKIKEIKSKEKAFIKADRPFYRPRLPNKNDQSIFDRLNDRRKTSQHMLRKNNKI